MYNVILLGIVSFLTDLSSEMVYPLLPVYVATRLGGGPAAVGIIEGIAESAASLLRAGSGYVSDRVGSRKPLTIAGYSSSVLGKLVLYFSTSWGWVLGARVVDRFGKGVRTAPRDALLAEGAPSRAVGGAFGLHRALDTAGAVVGAAVAYFVVASGTGAYRELFLYALAPAILAVAVLAFARETGRVGVRRARRSDCRPGERGVRGPAEIPTRLKAFLAIAFAFALGNSSNQFLLLKAHSLGYDLAGVLLMYVIYNVSYAALSYPAGRLSDAVGRKSLLVLGYAVYGLIYFGFALAPEPRWLPALFAAYGLYSGLTHGVEKALIADLSPAGLRATILGTHASLVGIGLLPASLLAGLLWTTLGPSAPFAFGGALGLGSALALWRLI